jgi:hypothetical protein
LRFVFQTADFNNARTPLILGGVSFFDKVCGHLGLLKKGIYVPAKYFEVDAAVVNEARKEKIKLILWEYYIKTFI